MKKPFFYGSLFILSWMYSVLFNVADWDLWARFAVGRIFFQIGDVLKNDIFSYTPTIPWVDHEWGSGVIFYFIANHFGDVGLILLKVFIFFSVLVLISKIIEMQNIKKNSHLNLLLYILIILGIFYGTGQTIRCQAFTFLFFTLWLYVLELVRSGQNRFLWIIPATAVIWANLHGGFVSGIGLLFLYGVGEFLNRKPYKKYFFIAIPAILITLINPYGLKYLSFILHATTMSRDTIAEWFPTNLFGPVGHWKGFKLFVAVSFSALIHSSLSKSTTYRELDKVKYILIFTTFYLALSHIKHQPFFVIASGSFLYHDFYAMLRWFGSKIGSIFKLGEEGLRKLIIVKDCLVFSLIFIAGGMFIATTPLKVDAHNGNFPVGSVEFIKENKLSGNLLTLFHWGSYAAWKLYPQCLVAIDGRYEETYPDHIYESVHDFMNAKDDKLNFIKEHHTDIIVVEKHLKSYIILLQSKFWKPIYGDKISAVFVPRSTAKKSYKYPKVDQNYINSKKYETMIDFFKE